MTHGTMHGIRGTSGNLAVHGRDDSGAGRADGTGADSAEVGGRGAIGVFLRDSRAAAGLSQRELASRSGLSLETIREWERGDCMPSLDKFQIACTVIGVDPGPYANGLRHSNASGYHAQQRVERQRVGLLLLEARRKAGATPEMVRRAGVLHRRLRSIEGGYSWPALAEVEILRACYRMPNLLPGYTRVGASGCVKMPGSRRSLRTASLPENMAAKVSFPVRRGSVWHRNGSRVMVECDATAGDRIRFRPLPDGEMKITSWATFMERYAEVGA